MRTYNTTVLCDEKMTIRVHLLFPDINHKLNGFSAVVMETAALTKASVKDGCVSRIFWASAQ